MRAIIVAGSGAIAAVALVLSLSAADAAPKKRATVTKPDNAALSSQARAVRAQQPGPRIVVRQAPARTRIIVRPRTFLDPGTEVWPGERKFTDYAVPPTHSAISVIANTPAYRRSPLPGPFDLPGRNNPMQWGVPGGGF